MRDSAERSNALRARRAGDPRECLGGKPVQTLHHPRGIAATLELIELGKQAAAVGESVESQAIGRVEVANLRPAEQVALETGNGLKPGPR